MVRDPSAVELPLHPDPCFVVSLIEGFFSILTRQGLEQAVHQSAKELEHFLKTFVEEYNKCCGPFEWTKGPEKLRRIIELTEQWQTQ
jgi:hypothetical protein